MKPVEPSGEDQEVDVLVVGAGAGGMTAALIASLEGLQVLLCEKTSQVGGTTATSGGTIWVPGSSQCRRAGLQVVVADARRYLESIIGAGIDAERREAFLQAGPLALDYLEARSEVKFLANAKHPDYQPNRPGAAVAGRALSPLPFDGRLLGKDFALVRPPIREFMVLHGMMLGRDDIPHMIHPFASPRSFVRVVRLLLRHVIDRIGHPRGTRLVLGNALVARLLYSLRRQGVPIWTGTTVNKIVLDGGRVGGAVLARNGQAHSVRVRRGLVLATGGFSGSAAWRQKLLPEPQSPYSVAEADDSGDGLDLGLSAGARIDDAHASPVFWMPASMMRRRDGSMAIFPHVLFDRAKPGLIAVNAAGRRFVNEADSYHDFVLGMYRSQANVPTIPAYLICDAQFIRDYGVGLIRPGAWRLQPYIDAGYLITAGSLAELAGRIGVDAAGLTDTVARHNRFAETGVDEDFGRGSSELNRNNGDPDNRPNPCLRKIEQAPFFAVAVHPADLGTSVGLATNADAQVLDGQRRPIAGLYACGNDMASIMQGHYPGPGITLGPAIAFAYRAAFHMLATAPEAATAPR